MPLQKLAHSEQELGDVLCPQPKSVEQKHTQHTPCATGTQATAPTVVTAVT